MSDQAVLDQLTISQRARFFWYEWQRQPPIPQDAIVAHASNLHLIPASKALAAQCESLGSGDLIHLSGLLVEASGNGACELVWVEEIQRVAASASKTDR